ncbi:M20 family metallo-hydrolase [Spirochaetia bacterium 38H-sp]|uniref:M20 family metallo-hydrolase n=1 Tax=Rarispira pelagica TaxID=3141764 RepID=A0ABU9UDP7_9SPIR
MSAEKIKAYIKSRKSDMIELQKLLTAIPALAPDIGGKGEWQKAEALIAWLDENLISVAKDKGYNATISVIEVPDQRAERGSRPSVICSIDNIDKDNNSSSFWIMTHLDVVPPGEYSLWETDPFSAVVKDGKIYGRGTEDNQQSLVSSIFAALAILELDLELTCSLKLLFVADEEFGNEYGIIALLEQHGELFKEGDVFLVPDGGLPDSSMIEVAEKSLMWLKFTTRGVQCHASRPDLGKNAFVAGSELVVRLASLGEIFSTTNELFTPPFSTFVPSKKMANVPNINTVPGEDVFYVDCRILPEVDLDEVYSKIESICKEVEKKYGVEINIETVHRITSLPTPSDGKLVKALEEAIGEVYGIRAKPMGIGGGTVAAPLRNKGFEAVVWSTVGEMAHQPNEYCLIDNMLRDAEVMALLVSRCHR